MSDKVTEFLHPSEETTSKVKDEPKYSSIGIGNSYSFNTTKYELERRESRKKLYLILTFFSAFSIFAFAAYANINAFKLDSETSSFINQAINAVVLLVIPFILGSVGGLTRILMSDVNVEQRGTLVVSSGLMAMFSWVGIKSGILLAIVAPHLEKQGIVTSVEGVSSTSFYTMSLVAIAVGIFSTNLYIFINNRVEQLASKSNRKQAQKGI